MEFAFSMNAALQTHQIQPAPPPDEEAVLERVLEALLAVGALTRQALERGRRAADLSGARVDRALNRLGLVSDNALVAAWQSVSGIALAQQSDFPAEALLTDVLAPSFLRHVRCVPLAVETDKIVLAIEDPLDAFTPAAVAAKSGLAVEARLARIGDIEAFLKRLEDTVPSNDAAGTDSRADEAVHVDVERLRDLASDAPVIRIANSIVDYAIETKASDIHLTATRTGSRLRYRIDGVLRDADPPGAGLHAAVISRLKIMAGLDIAERRLPQDGRIRVGSRGQEIDLRVATMPHAYGEGMVLRILDRSAVALEFEALGLSPDVIAALRNILAAPHGMFLVTGPTGSGKTTTLYAALKEISRPDRNVVTVEDPVEYHLDGVNQIQVARKIGLDFASALRAVLRQDPDVLMVGEIRDRETAAVAVQAALTGHLVLATLHTNTAAGALPRLIDMGVEPYLVASTVRAVLAQRLVRQLCANCKQPASVDAHLIAARGLSFDAPRRPAEAMFRSVGCVSCGGSGYDGRIVVSEYMPVTDEIRALILDSGDEKRIVDTAVAAGMRRLREDGLAKALQGVTTLDELARVTEAD
jgi:general secretion pathway protein E